MKNRIILLLFCLTSVLWSTNIKNFKIAITDKNLSEISYSDFEISPKLSEVSKISSTNALGCLILSELDATKYKVYINNKLIEDLFEECEFNFSLNAIFFSLRNFLEPGLNSITVIYESGEKKTWSIEVEKKEEKIELSYHKQVTSGKGWKKNIAISPDGRFMAYIVEANNYNSINIYNIETDNTNIIIENEKKVEFGKINKDKENNYSFAPCWSRDGSYLYFISNNSGFFELYKTKINHDGMSEKVTQLTKMNSYLCNITASSINDAVYFVSNKTGKMAIYKATDVEDVNNSSEFTHNIIQISPEDENSYFAPSISMDDSKLAFCSFKKSGTTSVIIYNLDNMQIESQIEDDSFDCLFPSWSPNNNIIAYYRGKSLIIENMEEEELIISSNCRTSSYAVKPFWDPIGNALYFISNDTNNSIIKKEIDFDSMKIIKSNTILNDKYYANNYEVAITPDKTNIFRSSFQSNYEIWMYSSKKKVSTKSTIVFATAPNTLIKYWDSYKGEYIPLALQPELNNKFASIEMDNLNAGAHRFQINSKEYTQKLFNSSKLLENNDIKESIYSLKYGLCSTFIPTLGQHLSSNISKRKFFTYSLLGLSTLAAGSAYYAETLLDTYEEKNDMKSLINARDDYSYFSSLATGFVIGSISTYLINSFDGFFSKKNVQTKFQPLHYKNFMDVTSDLPITREIYSKRLNNKGELKLLVDSPNVDVSLIDMQNNVEKYGKTNLVFNTNTFFTITDLDKGKYTLKLVGKQGNVNKETVYIEPNQVSYKISRMEQKLFDSTKYKLKCSIPGLMQFKRGNKIKAYSIIGFESISLISALIFQSKASDSYSKYNDSKNTEEILQYRSDYIKYSNLRNNFIFVFSLNYVYGYIDSIVGE